MLQGRPILHAAHRGEHRKRRAGGAVQAAARRRGHGHRPRAIGVAGRGERGGGGETDSPRHDARAAEEFGRAQSSTEQSEWGSPQHIWPDSGGHRPPGTAKSGSAAPAAQMLLDPIPAQVLGRPSFGLPTRFSDEVPRSCPPLHAPKDESAVHTRSASSRAGTPRMRGRNLGPEALRGGVAQKKSPRIGRSSDSKERRHHHQRCPEPAPPGSDRVIPLRGGKSRRWHGWS